MTIKQENKKTRPLTAKQRSFVKHYVETNNATKSATLAKYNAKTDNTMRAIASENLTKPNIINEIQRYFDKQDLEISKVIQAHELNILQDKQLAVSQQAINTYYDITGISRHNDNNKTNIAFILNVE